LSQRRVRHQLCRDPPGTDQLLDQEQTRSPGAGHCRRHRRLRRSLIAAASRALAANEECTMSKKRITVTDTILRDAHQSLLATRMRTEDMLPICEKLDQVGYWSLEVWGGATFDACVRFLKEDPWERLRQLRAALPNTRLQMLLRGQNLLGYRHYSDDVVRAF